MTAQFLARSPLVRFLPCDDPDTNLDQPSSAINLDPISCKISFHLCAALCIYHQSNHIATQSIDRRDQCSRVTQRICPHTGYTAILIYLYTYPFAITRPLPCSSYTMVPRAMPHPQRFPVLPNEIWTHILEYASEQHRLAFHDFSFVLRHDDHCCLVPLSDTTWMSIIARLSPPND